MWIDLVLLNLLALFGCLGIAGMVGMVIHPMAGLAILLGGFALSNWAWWDVYYGKRSKRNN